MLITAALAIDRLRFLVPTTTLFSASVPYFIGHLAWRTISLVMPKKFYVLVDDWMYSCYQRFALFIFEQVSGVRIVFYGDMDQLVRKKENVLYIANHQSSVDWVIADMLAVRQGSLGHLRYMLKSSLQWIPLFGYYFYEHGCVYVRRGEKQFNLEIANKGLMNLANEDIPFWLVIFPEGTRFSPDRIEAIAQSENFATSRGLAPLRHCFPPKIKGVQMALERLRDRIDAIYDVTAIYSESRDRRNGRRLEAPGMFDFVCCRSGTSLHVHIKRIPIADVPTDSPHLTAWLWQRFEEKDRHFQRIFGGEENFSQNSQQIDFFKKSNVFPNFFNNQIYQILPAISTLPPTFVLLFFTFAILSTNFGRKIYFYTGIFGTLGAFGWLKIRKAA